MAKYAWPAGSASKTVLLFIQDSFSTTGAGKTGISAGAVNVQEIRVLTSNTVAIATVSVTNLTALTDVYLSGGILQIDALNAPGWYRFDIPNSALSTGAVTAAISIIGSVSASNVAQLALEIQLQATPADTVQWSGASTSTANIALWQSVSSANVTQWTGASTTTNNIALWQSVSTANVTQWSGASTTTNNVALWSSVSTANVTQWTGVSTTTANIALWQSVSSANVTQWAATSTSASDLALQNSVAASVSAVVFGTTMTEAYAGTASAFNLSQFCFMTWSFLTNFSISGVDYRSQRIDNTAAMTFSLDSATSPAAIERTS